MNRGLPSFSIVVPTYQRPAQLLLCLQALARLDYPADRFEVLVVDDGNINPPGSILEEFRGLLKVRLVCQEKKGPAAARNSGSLHANGEFLAFTDDDCQPHPGWLRELAAGFRATPDGVLGGRTLNALQANPCSATSQTIIDVAYSHFNAHGRTAQFFASNNFAVPAGRFREVGGFDETFMTSEDREFCDRWRCHGFHLNFMPDAMVYHAHELTVWTLWQQHFGYGRGARRFHRGRFRQRGVRFAPDIAFYVRLLRAAALPKGAKRTLQMILLLFWSQAANAAGFFCEHIAPRERNGITPGSVPARQ